MMDSQGGTVLAVRVKKGLKIIRDFAIHTVNSSDDLSTVAYAIFSGICDAGDGFTTHFDPSDSATNLKFEVSHN